MAPLRVILGAALVMLLLGTCERKGQEPRLAPLAAWEVNGARVWQRITQESDYDNWSYWPGHEGMRPGQSPHGKYHEVYLNNTLREALPVADQQAPHGSIIVKENFSAAKEETAITVMVKAAGYNPEGGDWFWAAYEPSGKIIMEGKPSYCISCHVGMKDNDYVILRRLSAPLPTEN
jgi:hypothetical protein